MRLVDELEALVEPEGAGFARDALRRPIGVEHAESRAAGALSSSGGGEERDASRPRDCKLLDHFFFSSDPEARRQFRACAHNKPYGRSRTLSSSQDQEKKGGAR